MIKIAVVDDEKILLTKLGSLIEQYIKREKEIDYFDQALTFSTV